MQDVNVFPNIRKERLVCLLSDIHSACPRDTVRGVCEPVVNYLVHATGYCIK